MNRLISSSDKLHTVLQDKTKQTFELHDGLPQLFKISLKDRVPPLNVVFSYQDKDWSQLVDIYFSTEFREPRPEFGERLENVRDSIDLTVFRKRVFNAMARKLVQSTAS